MPVDYERKTTNRQRSSVYLEDMTLSEAIEYLQALAKNYGADAKLISESDPYSSSEKEYLHVYTSHEETDEQYNVRIALAEQRETARLERERQEYERLKKQFG